MTSRLGPPAALIVATLALASCGSGDSGTSSTSTSTTTTTSSASSTADASASGTASHGADVASLGRTHLTIATRSTADAKTATTRTLTCNPTGGTVADPAKACQQLAQAGGAAALWNEAPKGKMCTQQIAGEAVARITGTLDGRSVDTTLRQTDGCRIAQWNSLSELVGSRAGGN